MATLTFSNALLPLGGKPIETVRGQGYMFNERCT